MVRPKKSLGQHFLRDQNVAAKIVDALSSRYPEIIEIGPGTGVLTKFLIARDHAHLTLVEIDRESVAFLKKHYPSLDGRIIEGDFLKVAIETLEKGTCCIIGNFPYNISSQIFFKILDHHNNVREVVCMLQKEVADRLASSNNSKKYGILSVLLQAYYDVRILFTVAPGAFFPPPKVTSAVIRLTRNDRTRLDCDEGAFRKVVKQAFQTRRKTLRNALKILNLPASVSALPLLDKRAEQLTVDDFIWLTQIICNT